MYFTRKDILTINQPISGHAYQTALPGTGLPDSALWEVLDKNAELNDVKWQEGRCSGTVYCAEEDKNDMLSEVRCTEIST